MLRPSDNHRAALCRLSYDPARPLLLPLGKRSLPRLFLDRDPDGMPVVTCEGTRPDFLSDWRADFDQLDLEIDPTIDPVPHGWGSLMLGVIFRLMAMFPDPDLALGWGGHSMGASDAGIGAGLWKLAGRKLGRVTLFEPGPIGKLGGLLAGEDVLITRVGEGLEGDPVPEATPRGHPAPVVILPRDPSWNPFECHDMVNVASALAEAIKSSAAA